MIHVISGPPCAGKNTYIKNHRSPSSLVVDLDAIAHALGAETDHQAKGPAWEAAQTVRTMLIDTALSGRSPAEEVWIIDSLPSNEMTARYVAASAEITMINPGRSVCMERAETRPRGTKEAISRWFERAGAMLSNTDQAGRKTASGRDATPYKSVADERMTMKRTDITEIFPDATKEQIDKLLNINGADINSAKGDLDDVRGQLAAAQADLEKARNAAPTDALKEARDQAAALKAELDSIKRADALRTMREKVASETKVPATLLTGETEEACAEQAKAILAFAQPAGYPSFRDGGEVSKVNGTHTRDKFAAWAQENL